MVLLDIASPPAGDVGPELGRLCGAWSLVGVDAGAQGQLVGILSVGDGGDEVGKGVFVDVGQMAGVVVVGRLDPWREGVGARVGAEIGRHG